MLHEAALGAPPSTTQPLNNFCKFERRRASLLRRTLISFRARFVCAAAPAAPDNSASTSELATGGSRRAQTSLQRFSVAEYTYSQHGGPPLG